MTQLLFVLLQADKGKQSQLLFYMTSEGRIWIAIFFITVISAFMFLTIRKKMSGLEATAKGFDERISRRKAEIDLLSNPNQGKGHDMFSQFPNRTGNKLDEVVVNNNEDITALYDQIERLSKRLEDVEKSAGHAEKRKELSQDNPKAHNVFYMAFPVSNYFPLSAKSESKENTIYKFSVKPNGLQASFEVHTTGASLKDIAQMAETYIKPACDETNLIPITLRRIETLKPGLAELETDKWIIIQKAEIRYE